MSVVIQVKRNANTDAGALAIGEFGFHDVAVGGLWIGSTTGNQQIATKVYVDSVAQGLHPITDVVTATTEALAACAYDNGTAGVGATLTEDAANGALAAIDGVTLTLNQRVLVKDQADTFENGVYQLSTVGDGGTKWVLTRVTDMDVADEIASTFVFSTGGTVAADTGWVCTTEPESVVLGTSAITWAQFSAAGQITAGTGLSKTGNTIGVGTILGRLVTVGESASDGQILVGTASAGVLAWESGATALTSLGAQAALTFGITDTNAVNLDESVEDNDYAKFTGTGLEGRTYAEVKTDLGLTNALNLVNNLAAAAPPGETDDSDPAGYGVGSLWLDTTNDKAYICLDATNGSAVWKDITGAAGSATFLGLTDTPADYTDDGLKVVRVNTEANALEFVAFAATYLDDTAGGANDEVAKAATSNVVYDHGVATTGVHGAGGNTILHSGSTIDGGTWGA
jgi:hypothetical protein